MRSTLFRQDALEFNRQSMFGDVLPAGPMSLMQDLERIGSALQRDIDKMSRDRATGDLQGANEREAAERGAAENRMPLRALFGNLRGAGRVAAQILLLALALEVFAVVSPFFMQLVVDDALASEDRSPAMSPVCTIA